MYVATRPQYVQLARNRQCLYLDCRSKDVNGGQKICLRLRLPDTPATFYDEEDIVQTMLHEVSRRNLAMNP